MVLKAFCQELFKGVFLRNLNRFSHYMFVPFDSSLLGVDGNLTHHHGDQVPAVRVARAAQAAVNRVRAEVDQAHLTGVHLEARIGGALDHPRVNRASLVVDQASLESLVVDQADQETGVRSNCDFVICTHLAQIFSHGIHSSLFIGGWGSDSGSWGSGSSGKSGKSGSGSGKSGKSGSGSSSWGNPCKSSSSGDWWGSGSSSSGKSGKSGSRRELGKSGKSGGSSSGDWDPCGKCGKSGSGSVCL